MESNSDANMPEIVGLSLGDARILLEENDINIANILVTSPPRQKSCDYSDYYRVIRVSLLENKKVEILVCKPL